MTERIDTLGAALARRHEAATTLEAAAAHLKAELAACAGKLISVTGHPRAVICANGEDTEHYQYYLDTVTEATPPSTFPNNLLIRAWQGDNFISEGIVVSAKEGDTSNPLLKKAPFDTALAYVIPVNAIRRISLVAHD